MYSKLLRVKAVQKKVLLSELSQVNSMIKEEEQTLDYLSGVRDEYRVINPVLGRSVGVAEMSNQHQFVDKIVTACHLQQGKLEKLGVIRGNKIATLVSKNSEIRVVEQRYEEQKLVARALKDAGEDASNVELFNISNNFKKSKFRRKL